MAEISAVTASLPPITSSSTSSTTNGEIRSNGTVPRSNDSCTLPSIKLFDTPLRLQDIPAESLKAIDTENKNSKTQTNLEQIVSTSEYKLIVEHLKSKQHENNKLDPYLEAFKVLKEFGGDTTESRQSLVSLLFCDNKFRDYQKTLEELGLNPNLDLSSTVRTFRSSNMRNFITSEEGKHALSLVRGSLKEYLEGSVKDAELAYKIVESTSSSKLSLENSSNKISETLSNKILNEAVHAAAGSLSDIMDPKKVNKVDQLEALKDLKNFIGKDPTSKDLSGEDLTHDKAGKKVPFQISVHEDSLNKKELKKLEPETTPTKIQKDQEPSDPTNNQFKEPPRWDLVAKKIYDCYDMASALERATGLRPKNNDQLLALGELKQDIDFITSSEARDTWGMLAKLAPQIYNNPGKTFEKTGARGLIDTLKAAQNIGTFEDLTKVSNLLYEFSLDLAPENIKALSKNGIIEKINAFTTDPSSHDNVKKLLAEKAKENTKVEINDVLALIGIKPDPNDITGNSSKK
jgi:hypothetical protein